MIFSTELSEKKNGIPSKKSNILVNFNKGKTTSEKTFKKHHSKNKCVNDSASYSLRLLHKLPKIRKDMLG